MSSYQPPLIVEFPPSTGHSDQHKTSLPPKEQIVTSYWWQRSGRWPSRHPCGLPQPLRHGRHPKNKQIQSCYRGISTSSQNQRQKLHRHHKLHLRFAFAPTPYPLSTYPGVMRHIANIPPLVVGGGMVWQYAKLHTLLLWLTPEKDWVGHRCHLHSISGFSLEKDCIGDRPWEGAIGLMHSSCFRVAAAPTLATRGATICRIILDDLLFLKARR
jgi:hypothetical protein